MCVIFIPLHAKMVAPGIFFQNAVAEVCHNIAHFLSTHFVRNNMMQSELLPSPQNSETPGK